MSSYGGRRVLDPAGCPPWSVDPSDDEPPETSTEAMEEQEDDGVDHFDRLPDSVLLVVFNRIGDVKALGRCCVVSRRFQSLVPLVDDVVVRVDCVISDDPSPSSSSLSSSSGGSSSVSASSGDKARGVFSHLARLVLGGLVRPLHALGQVLTPFYGSSSGGADSGSRRSSMGSCSSSSSSSSSTSSEVSHHSPTEVLRNFKEIRRLRIELPSGELGVDEGVLLKWKADFGSTLDRCAILGSSSVLPPSSPIAELVKSPSTNSLSQDGCGSDDDAGSIPESFYSNGSLKLRVVWTISSLIAASARHYLLQPIIADHETLESLDLMDADGQGILTMDRRQLQELRVKPVSASGNSQRTLVPALSMRLWYAVHLELPGGLVLKGATLVAIRPTEERAKEAATSSGSSVVGSSDGCWVSNAFEEPYRTAAMMLMKRRTYCLEMNSF